MLIRVIPLAHEHDRTVWIAAVHFLLQYQNANRVRFSDDAGPEQIFVPGLSDAEGSRECDGVPEDLRNLGEVETSKCWAWVSTLTQRDRLSDRPHQSLSV